MTRRFRFIGVWDTVGALGIPLGVFKGLNASLYQFHDVTLSSTVDIAYQALAIDEHRKPFAPAIWDQQESAAAKGQIVRQMRFAGAHSNVGGGYHECGLSDQTFHWVADGAATAGLELDAAYVSAHICGANCEGELRDSMSLLYKALGPIDRAIAALRYAVLAGEPDGLHRAPSGGAAERIGRHRNRALRTWITERRAETRSID